MSHTEGEVSYEKKDLILLEINQMIAFARYEQSSLPGISDKRRSSGLDFIDQELRKR
jgi:hypothetical protein